MTNFFKKLFSTEKINIASLVAEGATVVDVRSPGEFKNGHVDGALNIPLDQIAGQAEALKEKQPIILCCASGMRSSSAASTLKSQGLTRVYNGGSWQKVSIQVNARREEE